MDEDLFVLLEPGVQGCPVEAHGAGERLDRWFGDDPGRVLTNVVAGLQSVHPCESLPRVPGVMLIDEQAARNVGGRYVVLGVVRPLPDVQRPRRVDDDVAGEDRPDPSGYRLDMVDRHDHPGVVAHAALPSLPLLLRVRLPAPGPCSL